MTAALCGGIFITLLFCNMGMKKPHKHWVYAVSVGGEDGIRTHVRLLAN